MDIKLRARLRAYGKLDISQDYMPHPTKEDAGKFVGIDTEGKYTLFENATEEHIDNIINETSVNDIPDTKKSFIDSMFD